ncbi:hypothetical protein CKAN_00444900 [Cinnamomum micranthum f. kanehirae]|uniref:Peptidase S8/S53 domain-containing protein n=1 Tax=Cinnamomum micranthum f. kanehirae TaxID=337451 RepID=A0A443NBY8_9MAGN|nr:hypothetical protein CKAN_00444900 [Cinnamomum micranthum f. kanehirae]
MVLMQVRYLDVAPWLFSVAANSIDRQIVTDAIVGDEVFRGRSINTFGSTKSIPLIDSANASTSCSSASITSANGALLSGAQGQITQFEGDIDDSPIFPLPSTIVDMAKGDTIKSYIRVTKNPQAKIRKYVAIRDRTAPVVVSFSSSVEIIAAYSPTASLTCSEQDKRSAKYAILSGTSMACPHVSGAAAYVKAFHPNWSPAAIKSALMTTAFPINSRKNVDMELAYGASQINPVKVVNPGLGYTAKEIRRISGANIQCRKTNGTVGDLNYPSIQLQVDKNRTFSRKFSRSVTNVGTPVSTYNAAVKQLIGLQVAVSPSVLSFKSVNEKAFFCCHRYWKSIVRCQSNIYLSRVVRWCSQCENSYCCIHQ